MNEIKISVIVPIYNIEKYLDESLGSLAAQTFDAAEFICVDDGSSDDSLRIIRKWAETDSRFVAVHKENGGVSSARNTGLSMAKGQWIMFLDGDDRFNAGALETVWKYANEKKPDIIVFNADIFPGNIENEDWYRKTLTFGKKEYDHFSEAVLEERGTMPFTWRHAYRKDIIERSGARYDERLKVGEDTQFPMCVFPSAEKFLFIDECLVQYRLSREGSAMEKTSVDPDKIVGEHYDTVMSAATYWNDHGLMNDHGAFFLKWALKFTLLKVKCLPSGKRKMRAEEFFERIVKGQGLERFNGGLGLEGKIMWNAFKMMKKI